MTEPEVYLIAQPSLDWHQVARYLRALDGYEWIEDVNNRPGTVGEMLAEFAGRLCYRSWKPGLNANVRKVRKEGYFENILSSGHGSILEHVNYSFVFANVSRVFTHELVRHRAGVAISQESGRFVRLDGDFPMWIPEWARQDTLLMDKINAHLVNTGDFLEYLARKFDLDNPTMPFTKKKAFTSFMRRFAPEGRATHIMWTANVRALRHVIEARTAPGAEEEIRLVFGKVAEIMKQECPQLFGDFHSLDDGSWAPKWSKV